MSAAVLIPTSPDSQLYQDAENRFWREWRGDHTKPQVVNVFYVDHKHKQVWYNYDAYSKNVGNEHYMWHGTTRACNIADDNAHTKPCNLPECAFCSILRATLDPQRARTGSMFGHGAYVAPNPNKSINRDYLKNEYHQSPYLTLMRCAVAVGNTRHLRHHDHHLRDAPDGYDSVTGVTRAHGGELDYPETVVYTKDAILPVEVIVLQFAHAGESGYHTTGVPRADPYSSFTVRLINQRDSDWNKYPEAIRNTYQGEALWTDGVVLPAGTMPSLPSQQVYRVVRRDPNGAAVAEGYVSANPFYFQLG